MPCWLVGWLVGGSGAWAVSRKIPIYFIGQSDLKKKTLYLYLSTGICNSSLKFGIERIIYSGIAPAVKYEIGPFSPLSMFEAVIR